MSASPSIGAIVVCGGESRRMGRDKASLPFGPETMLERVVRIVSECARPILVSKGADQMLPILPDHIAMIADDATNRGPWPGIVHGMELLIDKADTVCLIACDTPFLRSDWLRRLAELIGDHAAAVPFIDGFWQPLTALYRPVQVLPAIEQLLSENAMSPRALFERVKTRAVSADELRVVDPNLESLRNVNSPDEYRHALKDAGFSEI